MSGVILFHSLNEHDFGAFRHLTILATAISATMPSIGATKVCSIFMASMMRHAGPG